MAMSGGDFLWSACLRYIITLPFILLVALINKEAKVLFSVFFNNPKPWLIWGTVGFGLFYLCLTAAAHISPAWLIAGTFQTTIIAGLLISPFIYKDKRKTIPKKALYASCIILLGVLLSQFGEIKTEEFSSLIWGTCLVILSATFFPLGNRKILLYQETVDDKLSPIQRVACMTIGSMPLWVVVAFVAYERSGLPSDNQVIQSGLIALFSTIIATVIFFKATEMAGSNTEALGAVEATQSIEIVITLIAEILFLQAAFPSFLGCVGISIIIAGIYYYSKVSASL